MKEHCRGVRRGLAAAEPDRAPEEVALTGHCGRRQSPKLLDYCNSRSISSVPTVGPTLEMRDLAV